MRIVLLIVISILVYRSFLSPIVKRFEVGDGVDAFQEKLCISREWMMEYGATIESEEFTDIENRYHEIIAEIEKSMVQKKAFVECDVKNYKEFLEYQTNVLNGKEGFDYHKYKEMDESLFADTPYSSIYLQEYEKYYRRHPDRNADGRTVERDFINRQNYGTSNSEPRSGQRGADSRRRCPAYRVQYLYGL